MHMARGDIATTARQPLRVLIFLPLMQMMVLFTHACTTASTVSPCARSTLLPATALLHCPGGRSLPSSRSKGCQPTSLGRLVPTLPYNPSMGSPCRPTEGSSC